MEQIAKALQVYKGKRVLLTGHTGFKGSWLAHWLHELGAQVHGYALEPNTDPSLFLAADIKSELEGQLIGNIRDFGLLSHYVRLLRPDIVFHLAAQPIVRLSYEQPRDTIETNVMGTTNLLEAVRLSEHTPAVVVITSDKCYENKEWVWGYRENEAMGGVDPYSASKGAAELVCASYRRAFFHQGAGTLLATARAGNVIGGGDWARDRIVPDIVRALAFGESPVIRNPFAVRPWQHVLEPLSGYLWLGSQLLRGDRNFADGWNFGPEPHNARSVREVAEKACRVWKSDRDPSFPPGSEGPHEAKYLMLSIEKAQRAGWSPRWDFDDAIVATMSWYGFFYGSSQGHVLPPAPAAELRALMTNQIQVYCT